MFGRKSAELRRHRYAGYCLSVVIYVDVLANRRTQTASRVVGDFSQAYLATRNFGPAFVANYVLLGMAGTWYLIFGSRAALTTFLGRVCVGGGSADGRTPFPIVLKVVALVGHILIINAVLAIVGWHHYDVVVTSEDIDVHWKVNMVMGF